MIKNDRVYGVPLVQYKDTKANITALSGIGEGAIAYATDTNEFGSYDGTTWTWGQGGGSAPTTTAANDFQVGDGSGNWVKKTLAEVITIMRTSLDSVYAAITHVHAATDITSGTLDAARLPVPTTTTLGGVARNTGAAGEYVTGIDASGNLEYDTPAGGGTSYNGVIVAPQITWNSGTSITIGKGLCVAENGDVIDIQTAITISSLSISNATWYYVYVYLSSGVPAGEVVTTAPASPFFGGSRSKTSDTSKILVMTMKSADSGSLLLNFYHNAKRGRITYREETVVSPLRLLNVASGWPTTETNINASGAVPAGISRNMLVRISNTTNQTLWTNVSDGTPSGPSTSGICPVPSGARFLFEHPLDTSAIMTYWFQAAVSSGNGALDVYGYDLEF